MVLKLDSGVMCGLVIVALAILYWDLFSFVNEPDATIAQVWDGVNLQFTFRRCVSPKLFNRWLEVCQILVLFP